MAITTYAELKTAVASWLNRTDLTSYIPDFIRLAEAEFNRRLAIQDEVRTTLTLNASVVSLPTTCREIHALYLDQNSVRGSIDLVTPETLAEQKAILGPSGIPRYAAVLTNGTELGLAPVPDGIYTAILLFLAGVTPLSDSVTTNWLLEDHPDLYLYGTLVESAPFLRDDDRIGLWKTEREERLAGLDLLVHRRRFPTTPIVRPRHAIG